MLEANGRTDVDDDDDCQELFCRPRQATNKLVTVLNIETIPITSVSLQVGGCRAVTRSTFDVIIRGCWLLVVGVSDDSFTRQDQASSPA
jgi:hypothetical protein